MRSRSSEISASLYRVIYITPEIKIIRESLQKSGNPLLLKIARELVSDPHYSQKYLFIQILGDQRDTSSVPSLIELLNMDHNRTNLNLKRNKEETRNIRIAVIVALGKIGDAENSAPELMNFLADPDASIRVNAADALTLLGEPQWANIINGENEDFEWLGKTKDLFFLHPLINILTNNKSATAAKGLGAMGSPEAKDPLRKSLIDHFPGRTGGAGMLVQGLFRDVPGD